MKENVILGEDDDKLIEDISKFLEGKKTEILRLSEIYPKEKSIVINYEELEKFEIEHDSSIAKELRENPDKTIKFFEEEILKEGNFQTIYAKPKVHVRFQEIPKSYNLMIRNITSDYIDNLFGINGIVNKISDVLPKISNAAFQCPNCGNIQMVPQDKRTLISPYLCSKCKQKGQFRLITEKSESNEMQSEFTDIQRIEIQEPLEFLKGGEQARKIEVWVEDDLADRVIPGNVVEVTGVMKIIPPKDKGSVYYRYVDANNIRTIDKEFENIEISEEDEKQIKEFSKDPKIYEKIIDCIAPSIYGHREIKEAIALQLFGGTKKTLKDKTTSRSDIHLLLIGDPGVAKSRILQAVTIIAPKSIYVTGKGVTGAGLTATAEKDETAEGAWTLKAGALVLASGGVVCIDEFDKMDKDDRASMHEAMEQQSYHPDTPIMLSDGTEIKIGDFVDGLINKYSCEVAEGINCQILPLEKIREIGIFTTDFGKIYPVNISRVSRHTAPESFIKIRLQNGREVVVTPEHPCFVVENGRISTKRADELTCSDFLPVPAKIPFSGETQYFDNSFKSEGRKDIIFPEHNSPEFCRFLGYLLGDGGYELNRNKRAGINFYNKNPDLIEDFSSLMHDIFSVEGYYQNHESTLRTPSVRYISKDLVNFFDSIDSKLLTKGKDIRIPPKIMKACSGDVSELLKALFECDGHMSKAINGARVGFVSESQELSYQVQTLLLRFGIYSTIFCETLASGNTVYRNNITGYGNIFKFSENIGFISDEKNKKLKEYLDGKRAERTLTDLIPNCGRKVSEIAKTLKLYESKISGEMLTNHKKEKVRLSRKVMKRIVKEFESKINAIEKASENLKKNKSKFSLKDITALRKSLNFSQQQISDKTGVIRQTVSYWEMRGASPENLNKYYSALLELCGDSLKVRKDVEILKKLCYGDVLWVKITKAEKIPNEGVKWVYDVTVMPNQTFVSGNMILHNTISVAKAGMVTKFKAETSVLAAANPKFGRFDNFKSITEQFDIPPTLISRFDLIFAIRDVVDSTQDEKIADHILKGYIGADSEEKIFPVDIEFLRKYIAYSRKNIAPKLTKESESRIKEYYVKLRGRSKDTVPATARQLDALIRIAAASAKLKLRKTIETEDVQNAINLTEFVLREIATDKATGQLDIDMITQGPKSERDKIRMVEEVIERLTENGKKFVEISDILRESENSNIDGREARKYIEELKKRGWIYEPENDKYGLVR